MNSRNGLFAVAVTVIAFFLPTPAIGQAPSANSGISASDTYIVFDMSVQAQATLNEPGPLRNAANGATSNTVSLGPTTATYHVEAGYGTDGQMVVNFWPTGSAPNPATADASLISMVRFSQGQVTVFDQNGNPLPAVAPLANLPLPQPLAYLGSHPGPSVINGIVLTDVQGYAAARNATVTAYPGNCAGGGCPITRYDLTMSIASGGGGSAVWSYVPNGSGAYIASEAKIYPTITNGSASRIISFANVAWYDNSGNDATRAGQGNSAVNPPAKSSATPNLASPSESNCGSQQFNDGGTQNIVLQHGLLSSPCTWQRMYGWLQGDLRLGTVLIPSLSSTDSLANQSSALIGDINAGLGSSYVLIGHSQGGLIARDAAQYYAGQPGSVVKGVVTMDTPNEGADLAYNAYNDLASAIQNVAVQLYEDTGCGSPYDNAVCGIAALFDAGIPALAVYGVQSAFPATSDLVPGSAFLNNLNGATENFIRVGITSESVRRWVEMRLVGDAFCNPDDWCGGRNTALFTEVVYDVLGIAEAISIFEGDVQDAFFYAGLLNDMDAMDSFWNSLVAPPTDGTDGIVQASSEVYPSSSATQNTILFADSHLGTTKSFPAYRSLYQALENQFQVPLQADCVFSFSPSVIDTSVAGGGASASVYAGAGCLWSAASDSPWLTFASASQGNGNGALNLSIAANGTNSPRTGIVTLGNARASATLVVQQGAPCTYAIPGMAYFPSNGGSGSAAVGTSIGCVWSAVTQTPWLSITADQTGTGSGSFSFSASPNSGGANLTGDIAVMGQTMTVVIGGTAGARATGSAGVSGGPQSNTVCQYGHCHTTWESGTITLTVGGFSTSAYYSGTSSLAAQLASTLAQGFNQSALSPVEAYVSGTTISLTSKIPGAGADYPMSVSYSWSSGFPSSAYTISLSGSTMVGGAS